MAFSAMFVSSAAFTLLTVSIARSLSKSLMRVGLPVIVALVATPMIGLIAGAALTFVPAVLLLRLGGVVTPAEPSQAAEVAKIGMLAGFFVGALVLKMQRSRRR